MSYNTHIKCTTKQQETAFLFLLVNVKLAYFCYSVSANVRNAAAELYPEIVFSIQNTLFETFQRNQVCKKDMLLDTRLKSCNDRSGYS